MRYKSFRIRNFKGIKDTTVSLDGVAGASVFAFVGLNESGKTTVLEAIHSFSPDLATRELLGSKNTGVPANEMVPRHLISSFTGEISVQAVLSLTQEDKEIIAAGLKEGGEFEVDVTTIPDEVVMERRHTFKDGDFQKTSMLVLQTIVGVKEKGKRKWRDSKPTDKAVWTAFYNETPDIAYFPTLVFDFPKTIYLTNRGTRIDAFYRQVFQDILDYDGRGLTIEKDIVRRVRDEDLVVPWPSFLPKWLATDSTGKIQHVMDRAAAATTRLVFGRWNRIFGEDTKGKEVIITFEVVEGETRDKAGTVTKTESHDVFVRFQIKDGTRRFFVNDRSLGFRWFFAFMLFTQFRTARSVTRPLLFLFDEPASNLHAAAQQKLIDSFPEIAMSGHVLAYSTHSHYMIEPRWLEQTFIVTNRSDAPVDSILDDISLDDESLDIQVTPYRAFVNAHPSQTSYFQPILDRLDVVPSRFDFDRPSVVVEGKSDYYILRYGLELIGDDFAILPATGAGTLGALAALQVGWDLNFIFMLDGDAQGKAEAKRYTKDFGISVDRIITLDQLVSDASIIEDLVDATAKEKIRAALGLTVGPTKPQIARFFQERLASAQIESLGAGFRSKIGKLLGALHQKLDANGGR